MADQFEYHTHVQPRSISDFQAKRKYENDLLPVVSWDEKRRALIESGLVAERRVYAAPNPDTKYTIGIDHE